MTTPRDHMAADMAWLFAQDGEEVRDVVINGNSCRACLRDVALEPGTYEGALVQQRIVSLLPGTLSSTPRPGEDLQLDGEVWEVASSLPGPLLVIITLQRYIS